MNGALKGAKIIEDLVQLNLYKYKLRMYTPTGYFFLQIM